MPLHYLAWKKALGEWNCEFDEELFYAWGGMPVAEIISPRSTSNRDLTCRYLRWPTAKRIFISNYCRN